MAGVVLVGPGCRTLYSGEFQAAGFTPAVHDFRPNNNAEIRALAECHRTCFGGSLPLADKVKHPRNELGGIW